MFPELGDPPAWTRDQLEELNARNIEYNGNQYTRYEINQMQRARERNVRRWKKRYLAETEAGVDTTALTKDTKKTTTAKAAYNFTTVARKNFTVTTPADPEEPTPPQEEEVETPETPETPQTPEAPPVEDATPEEPAAPAAPELPAAEAAAALPKTGVNWISALGMALSGMLLTIAGAFASLKYKEKH